MYILQNYNCDVRHYGQLHNGSTAMQQWVSCVLCAPLSCVLCTPLSCVLCAPLSKNLHLLHFSVRPLFQLQNTAQTLKTGKNGSIQQGGVIKHLLISSIFRSSIPKNCQFRWCTIVEVFIFKNHSTSKYMRLKKIINYNLF